MLWYFKLREDYLDVYGCDDCFVYGCLCQSARCCSKDFVYFQRTDEPQTVQLTNHFEEDLRLLVNLIDH
jgi:hypothetical protein